MMNGIHYHNSPNVERDGQQYMPSTDIKFEPLDVKYRIEEDIGRGKFAVVKRCVNKETGEEVAAKIIRKRRRGKTCREEILREVVMLEMALDHPRLVQLKEVYETQNELTLITEYCSGGELFTECVIEESFQEDDVRRLMIQILEGLNYLHEKNIVHLDLKPQNILLTRPFPCGDIKLCDLGFACLVNTGEDIRDIIGTPDYVAPEVLNYEPLGLYTDMWSLGVLTYVMLTACSPFAGNDQQETFLNISQVNLDFPEDLFGDLSQECQDFISKLLSKNFKNRMTAKQCLEHPWLAAMVQSSKLPPSLCFSTTDSSKDEESDNQPDSFKSASEMDSFSSSSSAMDTTSVELLVGVSGRASLISFSLPGEKEHLPPLSLHPREMNVQQHEEICEEEMPSSFEIEKSTLHIDLKSNKGMSRANTVLVPNAEIQLSDLLEVKVKVQPEPEIIFHDLGPSASNSTSFVTATDSFSTVDSFSTADLDSEMNGEKCFIPNPSTSISDFSNTVFVRSSVSAPNQYCPEREYVSLDGMRIAVLDPKITYDNIRPSSAGESTIDVMARESTVEVQKEIVPEKNNMFESSMMDESPKRVYVSALREVFNKTPIEKGDKPPCARFISPVLESQSSVDTTPKSPKVLNRSPANRRKWTPDIQGTERTEKDQTPLVLIKSPANRRKWTPEIQEMSEEKKDHSSSGNEIAANMADLEGESTESRGIGRSKLGNLISMYNHLGNNVSDGSSKGGSPRGSISAQLSGTGNSPIQPNEIPSKKPKCYPGSPSISSSEESQEDPRKHLRTVSIERKSPSNTSDYSDF
ncbi:hypothetical protein ACJMK2_023126 [Sinanodonta woodiana]|uniref:non-specific serine/threonine protein kinase n=1 Tax=Sinanodonta woodiana TaxID=1069815 RepID=A0ABD3T4I1_SINWO